MGLLSVIKDTPTTFVKEQDVDSLAKLHNEAYPVLFRYIAFRIGDKGAAEQLTNELFTLFLEEPKARPQDAKFPQQLLLKLATKTVQAYQQNGTHPAVSTVLEANIQAAIAALPENYQILLALKYGCRLSIEQIAQALNESPETTRHNQARALMALHAKLQCR